MRELIVKWLLRLTGLLSFRLMGTVGAFGGYLMYRLGVREVRTARVNLAMCFPAMAERERERLVRRNLIETGRTTGQMLRIWTGRRVDLPRYLDENGFLEAGRALAARGKGVIFALPHLGNWELIGDSILEIAPTTVLFRPPRLAFLDGIMREGRARTGVTPVPIDRQGLKALHGALKNGEGVAILPDQIPKAAGASRVTAPFFGHPALTMTLVNRLARRNGSPVMFCAAIPDGSGSRFRMHHFEGEAAIAAEDPVEAAAALNRDVERLARAYPAYYQWTYRRFQLKGQKGPISPYSRHAAKPRSGKR